MAGTLTTSAGVTFFRRLTVNRLPTANSLDTSKLHIRNRNINPKASLHAVINEPLVKPKMKTMSLYEVLDVSRNATISEIKSAYRRLAKRYHPDACGSKQTDTDTDTDTDNDNDRDFVEICNAYVTLSDPTARALYDFKLSRGFDRRSGGMYAGAGERSEFFAGRRWETDQCW